MYDQFSRCTSTGGFYSYFYLNGSRENKTFKFLLLDNMFDGDGRFYARCLWKYLGCESTWKSTGREAIVLQAWFHVWQTWVVTHLNGSLICTSVRPFLSSLLREVSISMAVGKTKLLSFFSWIIYLMGTVDSTQDVYRNIWAVKVRGSLQDAKQLSFKHGFVYDKHVSSST